MQSLHNFDNDSTFEKGVVFIVFIQVILPILIVFASGYVLQRKMQLNIAPISTLTMYIFVPCLVFQTLYEAELDLQYVYMVLFFILFFALIIILNKIYVRLKGLSQAYESAYILSTAFMNTGNYGTPIILLAYGATGFDYAISFFVIQSISMHSVGLYYAARGKTSVKKAVLKVFQMPMMYAVLAALVLQGINVQIPDNLLTVVDLMASAAIPTVMVILGMQLAMIKLKDFEWGHITYTTVVRLIMSPFIAYFLTLIFPFDPLLAKVLILSTSMPSAVVATVYAAQFDAKAELVSSTTLINTLISIVTITVLLILLG